MRSIITKLSKPELLLDEKYTLKIGYPALSLGALLELENIVHNQQKVLEVGSGGSTIFWAKNCFNIKSFETDPDWFKTVNRKISRLRNVEHKLLNNKQIIKKINEETNNHYHIILINSNPKQSDRLAIANEAIAKVRRRGILIVNNYQIYGMQDFNVPSSWESRTFDQLHYSGGGTKIYKKL